MLRRSAVVLVFALAVAACGGGTTTPSTNADGSVDVHVTADDFSFKSDVTTFQAGVTYHFIVASTDRAVAAIDKLQGVKKCRVWTPEGTDVTVSIEERPALQVTPIRQRGWMMFSSSSPSKTDRKH